jgi:hypothetical protein
MCEGDLPGEEPQKTQITMPEEVLGVVPFVVIVMEDRLVVFLRGEELRGTFWRPGVKGRSGDEPPDAMVAVWRSIVLGEEELVSIEGIEGVV